MSIEHIGASDVADWIRRRASGQPRFLFGIAGCPGSGKTTLANRIGSNLGAPIVPMDGFHLPNAELDRRWLRSVKGAPQTFDAQRFVGAIEALKLATTVLTFPDFDRVVDEPRPDAIRVEADEPIVIIEGNYLLLDSPPWSRIRGIVDVVSYLDVENETRIRRLISRHREFGRTLDEATTFVRDSDERNSAVVDAVRHRAHLLIGGST